MVLEKGKISNFQLSVLVIGFVFGNSVIINPGAGAGHDTWIAVALGLAEGLLIAWICTALIGRFKDKTIIEINSLVYGSIAGKCVSILFIWYIFHLGALVLSSYARFFKLEVYPTTPRTVLLLLLMLVCASTVNRGFEVLARCSLILVPFTLLLVPLDTCLLIPDIDLNNLLPIFDVPVGKLLLASYSAASFPFAETAAFLMVLAFVDKPEKRVSAVVWGLIVAGFSLILVTARNAAVLGKVAEITSYQSYLTTQMIDIGDVLTRFEVVVAINLVTMGFVKITVLFYGTVLGLAQVFNLRSYRPLILPIGITMIILALTDAGNSLEMFAFLHRGYPFYAFPFQVGIPLMTLVIAKLRKLPETGGDAV